MYLASINGDYTRYVYILAIYIINSHYYNKYIIISYCIYSECNRMCSFIYIKKWYVCVYSM